MLKRQGKQLYYPSLESQPLNIIIEEDERSRSSSPTSCYSVDSQVLSVKARRRHATVSVSDLRLSSVFPDNDALLCSPRPAPLPPSSAPASPDSFRLTFTDISFKFPHPPIPTPTSLRKYECDSPTSSSSPASQTGAMPLTPSTSDDEFGPSLITRRPVIQPLVITKHNPRLFSLFDDDCAISPTLLQPFKTPSETLQSSAPLSPLSPSYLPEEFFYESDEASDSEPESDSEWYSKELSKTISLRSPLPPSFPLQTPARPDSIYISSADIPTSKRRVSKPLPPTPLSGGFPSAQLDPTFPTRRGSKRRTIPKYPPPPVPTIASSPTPSSSSSDSRRPPPRSSIPADCVYDFEEVEDASSTFSFSIYDVYLGDEPDTTSPPSSYSQPSYEDPIENVTFDLDYSMMLPLSLPTTPLDLEADIAQGLEILRNSPVDVQPPVWASAVATTDSREPEPQVIEQPQQQPQPQQPQVLDDIFSPLSSTFSSSSPTDAHICQDKTLKSKWSTSTLGSIREEHETRGASAKLRLYFSGNSPLKNSNKQGSKKTTPTIATVSSPLRGRKIPSIAISSPSSPSSPPSSGARSPSSKPSRARYSDVMVIGYGSNHQTGMRRRGSVTNSVSDAGSDESCSSTSSSGLRRKPIPVEMFLRSGV